MISAGVNLQRDGIKEALCDIRFETQSPSELVVGRLVDAWPTYSRVRLPTADIPAQVRAVDANLRYAPFYELRPSPSAPQLIRVGSNSVSCHHLAPYPGWNSFEPFLNQTVHTLYGKLEALTVTRIGFRYINALDPVNHLIPSARSLNLNIKVADQDMSEAFVLNYRRILSNLHICQVNIATPEYVQAPAGGAFSVLIDIDVFTPDNVEISGSASIMQWVNTAHVFLKEEFFRLLPEDVIKNLRRE